MDCLEDKIIETDLKISGAHGYLFISSAALDLAVQATQLPAYEHLPHMPAALQMMYDQGGSFFPVIALSAAMNAFFHSERRRVPLAEYVAPVVAAVGGVAVEMEQHFGILAGVADSSDALAALLGGVTAAALTKGIIYFKEKRNGLAALQAKAQLVG